MTTRREILLAGAATGAAALAGIPNVFAETYDLMIDMPLNHVIACCTTNAARAIKPFNDRGTLK